jgi:type II secretory pathway predicted ATPase ExeA
MGGDIMSLQLRTKQKSATVAFNQAVVAHPRLAAGLLAINQIHCSYASTPKGLMVLGETGTGKTTLAREYERKYACSFDVIRDKKPVLLIETPPSNSVDTFYSAILEKLGDLAYDKGRAVSKRKRIERLIKELGVEVLIFDEIQNLLPENAQASTRKISNIIKSLMNTLRIPVVLVGLPSARELLHAQPELQGRFSRPFVIQALKYHTPKEKEYFCNYLKGLQGKMQIDTENLCSEKMAKRFYVASGGSVREISNILDTTLECSDISKKLTADDYAKGFAMSCSNGLAEVMNPFLDDMCKVDAHIDMIMKRRP